MTRQMEAGGWMVECVLLRCKGVRLKVCSWEGVRGEVGEPE